MDGLVATRITNITQKIRTFDGRRLEPLVALGIMGEMRQAKGVV